MRNVHLPCFDGKVNSVDSLELVIEQIRIRSQFGSNICDQPSVQTVVGGDFNESVLPSGGLSVHLGLCCFRFGNVELDQDRKRVRNHSAEDSPHWAIRTRRQAALTALLLDLRCGS